MTVDKLQASVKDAEVIFSPAENNVYEFPSGKELGTGEDCTLNDLEKALEEWF
jgi:hypothetical protein